MTRSGRTSRYEMLVGKSCNVGRCERDQDRKSGDSATRRRAFRKFGIMLTYVIYFVQDRRRPLPREWLATLSRFSASRNFCGLFCHWIIRPRKCLHVSAVYREFENLRHTVIASKLLQNIFSRVEKLTTDLFYIFRFEYSEIIF